MAPITTATKNLGQHLEAILQPLPKTFMDAVIFTRLLGIHYLRIDSLCILQDSPDDWNTHAPHMASVYGQSYITISADAAEHSDAGFLQGANRHRYASSSVPFSRHGQTGNVLVRERGALAYELPFHDWPDSPSSTALEKPKALKHIHKYLQHLDQEPDPPRSALSKRGWAFQERILAPRTLYFGKGETGWECHGSMTCECSATSTRFRRREMHLLKRKFFEAPWELIVQKYTQLDLTMATDQLVALSGLAAAHYLAPTKTYIYGLWREDLRRSILWQALKPGKRLSIAPTWSWASTTSQIHFSQEPDCAAYKVIEGQHTSQNKPSEEEKELIIEGNLLQLRSIESNPSSETPWELGFMQAGGDNAWTLFSLNVCWDTETYRQTMSQKSNGRYVLLLVTKPPSTPAGLILQAVPNVDSSGRAGHLLHQRPLAQFTRVAICTFGDVVNRQVEYWSGEDFDFGAESDDQPRSLSTPLDFWKNWRERSRFQRFVLV
jgi:hypothetical protein